MIKVETKKVKDLSTKDMKFMNRCRKKEYGKGHSVNFKKEDKGGKFIFVKDGKKVMAFGMMKPIKVELDGKKYVIYGIGRGLAIEKGRGYGRILNRARINYLKKIRKTGVAFTSKKNLGSFKKVGYKIERDGIRKFLYKNPKGELIKDNYGQMVYYKGKDKFITKLLKSKNKAITDTDFW